MSSHFPSSSPPAGLIKSLLRSPFMMKLYGVLVLLVTLSAAYGLKCYVCMTANPKDCTMAYTCPLQYDTCASAVENGVTIKTCYYSYQCGGPIKCCDTDLCNGAIPTGSSVLLLLVSSAITAAFL